MKQIPLFYLDQPRRTMASPDPIHRATLLAKLKWIQDNWDYRVVELTQDEFWEEIGKRWPKHGLDELRDPEPELRIKLSPSELRDAASDGLKLNITCVVSVHKDLVLYELWFGEKGAGQVYRAHYCSRADNKLQLSKMEYGDACDISGAFQRRYLRTTERN